MLLNGEILDLLVTSLASRCFFHNVVSSSSLVYFVRLYAGWEESKFSTRTVTAKALWVQSSLVSSVNQLTRDLKAPW